MAVHMIKRGLDLPITGQPEDRIDENCRISRVAVTADDYPLMKPRMHVAEGDSVKRGQLLFEDRKAEGVLFTAPGAGTVVAINRGARRVLQSVVIELSDAAIEGNGEQVDFENHTGADPATLDGDALRALLSESGLWTAFRTRPYSRVPSTTDTCASIFVTAIDTNPLAGSVKTALSGREADFKTGLAMLTKLTDGKVRLCTAPGAGLPTADGVHVEEFGGKHPAGLVGTHIHMLEPVGRNKSVWHIGYQDVAAIGALVSTGKYDPVRVIAVAGPVVREPRLIRARLGACIPELTAGHLPPDQEVRVISGSILHGRTAQDDIWCFVGRYHNQVSCLAEDRERVLFGWLMPGLDKFSSIRTFASGLLGLSKRPRAMTTTTNGSHRAMVPIGMFERVMPLDIMPTFLLRALVVDDLERAEALGCLELDEEDLALCSFVSPGKEDFGRALRRNLDTIWKEG